MSIRTIQGSSLGPKHTAIAAKRIGSDINITDTVRPWIRNPAWLAIPDIDDTAQEFHGLISIYDHTSAFCSFETGIVPTNQISAGSTTDASSYTTGSTTYLQNFLVILTVENSHDSDAAEVASVTGAAGAPEFTVLGTVQFNGGLNRITVLAAVPAAPYTGTLTISFDGQVQTGAIWNVTRINNANHMLEGGIAQLVSASGTGTQPATTLGSFADSLNSTFCAVASVGTSLSAGTGFTQYGNTNISTPDQRLMTQWRADNETAPTATTSDAAWGMIAIELHSCIFSVDWGDGSTESVSLRADHQYDYNSVGLADSNIPVTIDSDTDSIVRSAHGFVNGDLVNFYDIQTNTDILATGDYYVVNSLTDTFQIALVPDGDPVVFTENGTATLLPYKQSLVSVIPQNSSPMSHLNLNVRNPANNAAVYESGWLDIIVGSENFTLFSLTRSDNFSAVSKRKLERVRIRNIGRITSFNYLFSLCSRLREVEFPDTQAVTTMSFMFNGCTSLQTVPLFNTQAVTTMSTMFQRLQQPANRATVQYPGCDDDGQHVHGCSSLQTVPLFNTQAVTQMSSMFSGCSSLQTVPLFNTQAVTNMSGCTACSRIAAACKPCPP
jgi:surface protein